MTARTRASHRRSAVIGTAALALAGLAGYLVVHSSGRTFTTPEQCVATAAGYSVTVDPEQAHNASVIAAVGIRRGLPARAVSIALATAYQESDIHNLDHGDRDSLGIFQQRPSQGWGSARQVMNPYHATNAFYDALSKVDGYDTMRITTAAQLVQRSAFGEAYAVHELDARTLASALTGYSPAGFHCVVRGRAGDGADGSRSVRRQRHELRHDLRRAFGGLAGVHPGPGRRTTVVTVGQAGIAGLPGERRRLGWAVAHYLVANAGRLDIRRVEVTHRRWTRGPDSVKGWRHGPGEPPGVVRLRLT